MAVKIDQGNLCLYVPACGAEKYKFYMRIRPAFGIMTRSPQELMSLPSHVIPVIGGSVELRDHVKIWKATGRPWIYFDRGYFRRIFEAWLPKGVDGGYYRFNHNCCSMPRVRAVPGDRWEALDTKLQPWQDNPGGHIVVAPSLPEHDVFHDIEGWLPRTLERLQKEFPDREIINRYRNSEKPLWEELSGAKCLVTHGSNAANEAIVMGYPVIALGDCAAGLVGRKSLDDINDLVRPEREDWCRSMAYNQYTEAEIIDGSFLRMMDLGD